MRRIRSFGSAPWSLVALVVAFGSTSACDDDKKPPPLLRSASAPPSVAPAVAATAPLGGTPTTAAVAPTPVAAPSFGPAATLWVQQLRIAAPLMFCENPLIRRCYPVAEGECKTLASKHLDVCVARMPGVVPELPTAQTGQVAGEALGLCMGTGFDLELAAAGRRVETPECVGL